MCKNVRIYTQFNNEYFQLNLSFFSFKTPGLTSQDNGLLRS